MCGETIDIVATRNGKRIAFETETGTSGVAQNVRECPATGLEAVVVVAATKGVKDALVTSLPRSPGIRAYNASRPMKQFGASYAARLQLPDLKVPSDPRSLRCPIATLAGAPPTSDPDRTTCRAHTSLGCFLTSALMLYGAAATRGDARVA